MKSIIRIICKGCGIGFDKNKSEYKRTIKENGDSMYCSRSCAGKYIPRPNKKYIPITSKCKLCQTDFPTTNGPKARKCCSILCARKFARSNRKISKEEIGKIITIANKKAWSEGKYQLVNFGKRRFNSAGEIELREYLKKTLPDYEFTSGMLGFGTGLGVDVISKSHKVIVEYDGAWHFKDINGQLLDKQEKDKKLEFWCLKNGWRCVRIKEDIYKKNKLEWQEKIKNEILFGKEQIVKYY